MGKGLSRTGSSGLALRERGSKVPAAIGDAMGLTPDEVSQAMRLLRRLTVNVTDHG